MQPRSHFDPERLDGIDDRHSAAHRAGRPIERSKEAVARGVDLDPAITGEESSHHRVMPLDDLAPAAVSELRGALRRIDDVGEKNGCENPGERCLFAADFSEKTAHPG